AFARTALEKVIATTKDAEYRAEAMGYMAQLEVKNNSPAAALDLYERLLKEQARTKEAKANVHYEAARLAFDLKQWERSRGHARAKEIGELPSRLRYRCDMLAAECLSELEAMLKNRLYAAFEPEIDLKLAEGWFLVGKADKATDLLKRIPGKAPKT